jgi:hypothetical protein
MKHNLIGLSGKMGSGKDTVALMIQYLLWEKRVPSVDRFSNYIDTGSFRIKKFGGKLKQIAAILLGCEEEDFEDRDFKNKELGPEWTVYDLLYETEYEDVWHTHNKIFLTENDALDYEEDNRLRGIGLQERRLTPRLLLQLLGTECGRQIIHPNVWVYALFADYHPEIIIEPISEENKAKYPVGFAPDIQQRKEYPNWLITDMRFPNELAAVKEKGGLTIRVNLIGKEDTGDHPSETALDDAEFDVVINCEFGLDKLLDEVINILPLIV